MTKSILIISLMLMIGNAIGQTHYFDQTDHIPLMILKSTGTTPEPQPNDFQKIVEIGGEIFHCDGLSQEWYNFIADSTPSYFKIIPYTVPVLGENNYIAKYSEAMYSEWNVVDNGETGTYSFKNDFTKVNKTGDYIITKPDATDGIIVSGPGEYYNSQFWVGYPQQEKFLIAPTDVINYNLRIELKLGDLYQTPPSGIENTDAEICRMEVGWREVITDINGNVIRRDYHPHASRVIKLSDFENSFGVWKDFELNENYTWSNTNTESLPMFMQKEENEGRKFQLNMEFRLVWKEYPYRQLSVRNLFLFDMDRGKPFMEDDYDVQRIMDLTQNQYDGSPLFNASTYDDRVIGWNAVDEPGSGENYACMRKIDELMNTASGGKRRLYFSNAGIFNGWVGRNILAHEYQLNRTGNIPLPTLQNYIVEYPYQSLKPNHIQPGLTYHSNIAEVNLWNILHFINNIEQFSNYDKDNNYNRPFGLMLQSGKWEPMLLGVPSKAQLLYTANMGLLYGAKLLAVNDFFYDATHEAAGKTALYNLTTQEYSLNAKTIRDTLSPRLKGLMGKTLKNLNATYQKTGINAQDDLSENINTEKLNYIHIIPTEQDPPNAMDITIADVGIYRHKEITETKDYFIIVNRHYSSESSLTIGLKDLYVYSNWTLINLTDTVSTTINKNPGNEASFNEDIPPGDGKLYSLAPTVIYGGELTSDETIATTTTLNGNLIVGTGVTLTVNSVYNLHGDITIKSGGAIKTTGEGVINVYQGKQIIAEGISEISGTSTGKITINFIAPVQNNGIYASQEAFLTVNYAKIMNAVYGIIYQNPSAQRLNGSLTITNCEFINCNTGIKLENLTTFTPLITTNIFTDCNIGIFGLNNSGASIMNNSIESWSGIWLTNTAGGSIINNRLEPQTANNGVGIYLQSSQGTIRENYIDNFSNGIFLANSSPMLGENTIKNNSQYGIYCGSGSSPQLSMSLLASEGNEQYFLIAGLNYLENNGYESNNTPELYISNSFPNLDFGYNCIIDDRDLKSLLIDGQFTGIDPTLPARMNYWGDNGNEPYERFGINVDYGDYLTMCAQEGLTFSGNYIEMRDNNNVVMDTLYSLQQEPVNIGTREILESEAENAFITGDYSEAKTRYLALVTSYGAEAGSIKSYHRLYESDKATGMTDETINSRIMLFEGKANQTTDTLLMKMINQIISLYYIERREFQTALSRFEGIMNSSAVDEEILFAELDAYTVTYLSSQSQGGLGKVKEGKYFVKPNEDYTEKIMEVLSKKFSVFKSKTKKELIPEQYNLFQNYPNPFNPVTTIKYQLPVNSKVTLTIYDILGKEVTKLVNQEQEVGNYEVKFNGSRLASGVYICRMIAGNFVKTIKMSLLK